MRTHTKRGTHASVTECPKTVRARLIFASLFCVPCDTFSALGARGVQILAGFHSTVQAAFLTNFDDATQAVLDRIDKVLATA